MVILIMLALWTVLLSLRWMLLSIQTLSLGVSLKLLDCQVANIGITGATPLLSLPARKKVNNFNDIMSLLLKIYSKSQELVVWVLAGDTMDE